MGGEARLLSFSELGHTIPLINMRESDESNFFVTRINECRFR